MKQHARIAHVSDLHLGVEKAEEIWLSLRRYLNESLKPDLVLITGDIVDDPSERDFRAAAKAIDELSAPYMLCPGNHDRHWRGNASRIVDQLFGKRNAWFDQMFGARIARPDLATPLTLGDKSNPWKVVVVGFDTSLEAKYSAQGLAGFGDLEVLKKTLRRLDDVDVVIVLLHHHLLPIAELERFKQQLRGLLKPTTMLNAGTMLERLAKDNVNLVLHGHEHHRSVARYGTLSEGGGDVVVLAAGSATGVQTMEGAEPSRASFNLIELRADRTVWVFEFKYIDQGWERLASEIKLLDDGHIEQARFFRRNSSATTAGLITKYRPSQVVRCFEFHYNRDIGIVDRRTNWTIQEGKWQLVTKNSSGTPLAAEMVFEWLSREPTKFGALDPVVDPSDYNAYRFEVNGLSAQGEDLARQITTTFRWKSGGILTESDLELLDKPTRGPFRREGYEFAGFEVENNLKKLSLMVRLPPDFAPAEDDIQVWSVPQGRNEIDFSSDALLTRAVQHHAPGMFSLEVNYPTKGAAYVITWKPPPAPEPGPAATAFRTKVRDERRAAALLRAVRDAAINLKDAAFALYVPMEGGLVDLQRVAHHVRAGESAPPQRFSLKGAFTREVWFGQTLIDDEDPDGALVTLPISPESEPGRPPWAVVRIRLPPGGRNDLRDSRFLDMLEAGKWALLLEAVRME